MCHYSIIFHKTGSKKEPAESRIDVTFKGVEIVSIPLSKAVGWMFLKGVVLGLQTRK